MDLILTAKFFPRLILPDFITTRISSSTPGFCNLAKYSRSEIQSRFAGGSFPFVQSSIHDLLHNGLPSIVGRTLIPGIAFPPFMPKGSRCFQGFLDLGLIDD